MSANKRRDFLSNHEAINIALLDINKLQQLTALHTIIIPKSLLANLRYHFTGLGTQHSSLLRHLERYNIANRKLAQQVESFQSEQNRRTLEEGQSVLRESIDSATILQRQIREMHESAAVNAKEILCLKAQISQMRQEGSMCAQTFESTVDKLNLLMLENIKRRERETSAMQQLQDISCCSERFTKDLENLQYELEEEKLEQEQRAIDYEMGKSKLTTKISMTTEKNVQLSRSLEKVVSEANNLRDSSEGKQQEVARLERRIAEVANIISQLRSTRDGKVETLGQLEAEKQHTLEKIQSIKGEHKEMEEQLQKKIENLNNEIHLVGTENKIKEEKKRKLHDELVKADMLEGVERKRLQELKEKLNCKSEKLLKQSSKMEEMKRAITNRNLQLDHCLNLISSSERVQEAHLSKLNLERVCLEDDIEKTEKNIELICDDTIFIRKAHEAVLSETHKIEEELIRKISVLNATGKELEQKVQAEKARKQELEDTSTKLNEFNRATTLLHCHAMETHAIRGKTLKVQTEQMSNSLHELLNKEQTLTPILQDAEKQLQEVTARRTGIEENISKVAEKLQRGQDRNASIEQMCMARQEELAKLRNNAKMWGELEAQHMMKVEREAIKLRNQQSEIDAVNKDLQVALSKLDRMLERADQARTTAPEQFKRLSMQCTKLRTLTHSRRHVYLQLEGEIRDMEKETAKDVTNFEKKLHQEEEKLSNVETKLQDMLLNLDNFFKEVEYNLQTDSLCT